ncbi:MAG: hypothetical protein LJE89_10135 [Deltaproteobacteria bacterium]|nr:hypothetical protein [Deltaproteobacteria bacterium]
MGQVPLGFFIGVDSRSSSAKLHIRISWSGVCGFAAWLSPRQMKAIPVCQSKTPVAQMHFASEHLLSKANHGING